MDARSRWGWAWLAMCGALALHVADEALTDFLSVYNPTVRGIRERFPAFPVPELTFDGWLSGLMVGIAVLLLLSPFAFSGARWMRPLSYLFAGVMTLNGIGHIAGSVFVFGRPMPGAWSSPLLLAAGYLLVRSTRAASSPSPSRHRSPATSA